MIRKFLKKINVVEISYVYIFQFSNFVIPLLIYPLLLSILSIDDFGKIISLTTSTLIFQSIVDWGYNSFGIMEIKKNNQIEINFLLPSITNRLLIFILIFPFSFLINYKISLDLELSILFSIIGLSKTISTEFVYHGLMKYKELAQKALIEKLILLTTCYLFIVDKQTIFIYPILILISSIVANVFFLKKALDISIKNSKLIYMDLKQLHHSFYIFLSSFVSSLQINIPIFLVSILTNGNLGQIGEFSIFEKIIRGIRQLGKPFLIRLVPKKTNLLNSKNYIKYLKKDILKNIVIFWFLSLIVLLIISPLIKEIYLNSLPLDFYYFIKIILYSIIIPVGLINYYITYVYALNNGKEKTLLLSTVLAIITIVVLELIFNSIIPVDLSLILIAVFSELFLLYYFQIISKNGT